MIRNDFAREAEARQLRSDIAHLVGQGWWRRGQWRTAEEIAEKVGSDGRRVGSALATMSKLRLVEHTRANNNTGIWRVIA